MDASNKYVHTKAHVLMSSYRCGMCRMIACRKKKANKGLQATLKNHANIKSADKKPHCNLPLYRGLLASNVPVSLWERKEDQRAIY